jgi:serine/threonine-protein kinase
MIASGLPQIIGGKYRPYDVLGEGAMGIVYAVQHTLTDECFALKVMMASHAASPDAIERFKREARTSSRIKSEHVVRVLDADVAPELGGAPYLVMDLLEGADLEQVSDDKPVEPQRVVEWLRQVARPIDKAHRTGIIHRDLKPENLFLTHREDGSPVVKILDFGIAKIAAESTGSTQSGQLLGTPLYMAPEQARGDSAQIGPATDLFALGLIAYKLLTGLPYWRGTSVAGIIGEILYEPLAPPSARGHAMGAAFDAWFLRACHRDPPRRFESAEEQVEALARALGLPVRASIRPGASSSGVHRDSMSGAEFAAPSAVHGGSSGVLVTVAPAAAQEAETKRPRRPDSASSSAPLLSRSDAQFPPKWRRAIVVTISAAAVVSIFLIVLHRRAPAHVSMIGNQHSAAATESVVTLVATSMPPVAPPSAAAVPRAVAEPPASSARSSAAPVEAGLVPGPAPAAASVKKEPLRALRTSVPSAPSRHERMQVDDVLTDQK